MRDSCMRCFFDLESMIYAPHVFLVRNDICTYGMLNVYMIYTYIYMIVYNDIYIIYILLYFFIHDF